MCVFAHSGIITNTGGKVIVRKMAGQNIYKGSNSNGVRSLSLPKWRESFVVSGISNEGTIINTPLTTLTFEPTAASVVFQWGNPREESSTHLLWTMSHQDQPTWKQVRRGFFLHLQHVFFMWIIFGWTDGRSFNILGQSELDRFSIF